jgi:hypothetical protein
MMSNHKATGTNEFEAIQLGAGSFFCEEVALQHQPSIYEVTAQSNLVRVLSLTRS